MATVMTKPTIDNPSQSIIDEGQKLGTIIGGKDNDNDLAILTNSATIRNLIALVMDLNARVKALEAKP